MPAELLVALAQIAPVFLDRTATLSKVIERIDEAAAHGAGLVVFGEALVPGYPVWVERTDGARFEADEQKELFARYARAAVVPEEGHLDGVRERARAGRIAVVLGMIERARDRGGHSLYCTLVHVSPAGGLDVLHRKLVPTYEERLVWSNGDGAGLTVRPVGPFTVGALNCWENWLPLARAALHAQGEDLHIALWPGARRNTHEITRFMALEGRSYVLSVSGLLRAEDIPDDVPLRERIVAGDELLLDGGSCLAAPDGSWVLAPEVGHEGLFLATLDHDRVLRERHNLDASGHYARPDVFRLDVDRRRQSLAHFRDA